MKIITKKHLIETVAERWKECTYYQDYDGVYKWAERDDRKAKDIYHKLLKLSKPTTEQEITGIIGNDLWTKVHCNECDRDNVEMVVSFCDGAEREATGKCLKCLKKAITLIEEEKP